MAVGGNHLHLHARKSQVCYDWVLYYGLCGVGPVRVARVAYQSLQSWSLARDERPLRSGRLYLDPRPTQERTGEPCVPMSDVANQKTKTQSSTSCSSPAHPRKALLLTPSNVYTTRCHATHSGHTVTDTG